MDKDARLKKLQERAERLSAEHAGVQQEFLQTMKRAITGERDEGVAEEIKALNQQAVRLQIRMLRCRASVLELSLDPEMPDTEAPDTLPEEL